MSPGATVVGHQHLPGGVDDLDGALGLDLEGLVVGAVLLGLLGHQTDVGDGAHRGRVEGTVLPAVLDDSLEHTGVGGVRDDGESVLLLVILVPHVSAAADHGGHGGVDDDVGGDVQAGDALVRVDHGQVGAVLQALVEGGADLVARSGPISSA
jgi:hypothetical protein